MKTRTQNNHLGFTFIELLVVTGIVTILFLLFSPAPISYARPKAKRIQCAANLRQTGIAFTLWAQDHGGRFPMFRTNTLGLLISEELRSIVGYYAAVSNYIGSPIILHCPEDKQRHSVTNFTPSFNATNISYFLGIDADTNFAASLLAGDRNITNGNAPINSVLALTSNQPSGWTSEVHKTGGNIVMSDGSVMQLTSVALQNAVANSGLATNRLLFP